jgi:hypothetical protein
MHELAKGRLRVRPFRKKGAGFGTGAREREVELQTAQ